ncbi:MAG: hypothetical protein K2P81_01465 [Bacteriovoracaceae bacterium]|nr:hypothetical protein [Bacteriovoracaceae bacterium]
MKVVTWNCNGAFRKKFNEIITLEADIYVIQECEDPAQTRDKEYKAWSKNYLWHGLNKNKGIGVFCREDLHLEKLDWSDDGLQLFLPFKVNSKYSFIGIWTKQANSPNFRYIGQVWKYLQKHSEKFQTEKPFLVGDWNSNKIWDEWDRWWNHTDVVKQLDEMGLVSAYHTFFKENQGEEKKPTLYFRKNKSASYHVDYIFLNKRYLKNMAFEIGDARKWLKHSDHMPLVVVF